MQAESNNNPYTHESKPHDSLLASTIIIIFSR